jgi:hypothetical protein
MDAFIGISNWIDVVYFGKLCYFMQMSLPSLRDHSSFKSPIDPLSDPIELDAIYNHIPNGVLPMKTP